MNRFYFYKQGRLTGPHSESTFQKLKASGEFSRFSWFIDEQEQIWKPIDPCPTENPFLKETRPAPNQPLTAAVIHRGTPLIGIVTRLDSFGIDFCIDARAATQIPRIRFPNPATKLHLNVVNEENHESGNYPVLFETLTQNQEGLFLRFTWQDQTLCPTSIWSLS